MNLKDSNIEIKAHYDEFSLALEVTYNGPQLATSENELTMKLLKMHADSIQQNSKDGKQILHITINQ